MNKEELIKFLEKRGYTKEVIDAFREVKREEFVPEHLIPYAYEDIALPIEDGSAISQPSSIAFMLELLQIKKKQKILEVGSGSGYVLKLLSYLAGGGEVYGVEINRNLAVQARKRLSNEKQIHIINKDGITGLPSQALFDRILVSATFKERPYHLLKQLTDTGILVAPVKDAILCIKKDGAEFKEELYPGFAFLPIVGE